jgi:hypothetical protein
MPLQTCMAGLDEEGCRDIVTMDTRALQMGNGKSAPMPDLVGVNTERTDGADTSENASAMRSMPNRQMSEPSASAAKK